MNYVDIVMIHFIGILQLVLFIGAHANIFEPEHAHDKLKETHYDDDGTHNPEYDHELLMGQCYVSW